MAKIHRNSRRDDNEADIVSALEQVGASVTLLEGSTAPGVPDLLVGRSGKTYLLEVKAPLGPRGGKSAHRESEGGRGELTSAQVTWWQGWKGQKAVIVRTPREALDAIGVIVTRYTPRMKDI